MSAQELATSLLVQFSAVRLCRWSAVVAVLACSCASHCLHCTVWSSSDSHCAVSGEGWWFKSLGSSACCCCCWQSRHHVTCQSPVQSQQQQHRAAATRHRLRPPASTFSCRLFSLKWCVFVAAYSMYTVQLEHRALAVLRVNFTWIQTLVLVVAVYGLKYAKIIIRGRDCSLQRRFPINDILFRCREAFAIKVQFSSVY